MTAMILKPLEILGEQCADLNISIQVDILYYSFQACVAHAVMEKPHVTFFFMNLGFVYYSVYGLAILLFFRVG